MNVALFSAGEQIDAMTFAGDACEIWTEHGIAATVFPRPDGVFLVPLISSEKPGTGMLDTFLRQAISLAQSREARLVFVNVINAGLERHLRKLKIAVIDLEPDQVLNLDEFLGGMNVIEP